MPKHKIVRKEIEKRKLAGTLVSDVDWKMSYVLGAIGGERPRFGGELGADGRKWSELSRSCRGRLVMTVARLLLWTLAQPGGAGTKDYGLRRAALLTEIALYVF
ncbi:MAG: hypothetical protein HYX78_07605 [Armatimonadetes bacterium]|nr:hypothetical protein [Armatimonadota bacterium]